MNNARVSHEIPVRPPVPPVLLIMLLQHRGLSFSEGQMGSGSGMMMAGVTSMAESSVFETSMQSAPVLSYTQC